MTSDQPPVDAIAPLTVLAEEMGVDLTTMRRWADADRKNNFPKPVDSIGKINFYLRAEVERWVALYNMTGYAKNAERMRKNG